MFLEKLAKVKHSLRTRIVVSVLVMLLPAAVLMYNAYIYITSNIQSLNQVIDTPLEELMSIKKIQTEILKIELPFHLYLNRGESADRDIFLRTSVNIDLLFENALRMQNTPEQDIELFKTARKEWQQAKTLGGSLLSLKNIPDSTELIAKVDQFGRHINRAASLLDEISDKAFDTIKNHRYSAQESEWKSITVLMLVFGLGMMLAVLAALWLGQSVVEPIKRLEKSVNQFGEGDTSARANLKPNNELGSLASAFNTLAERYEQIQSQLDYLSVHDNLTGLFDRAKFNEEVATEVQRAKRYERAFSLLFIDINHFKDVNKQYGRLVGDSVLCSVGNKICATVRPTDMVARYEGDKFAVILSETDVRGAQETAVRLEEAIQNDPFNIGDGTTLSIKVRIGVGTYPNDADTDADLLSFADQSLNSSKSNSSASIHVSL